MYLFCILPDNLLGRVSQVVVCFFVFCFPLFRILNVSCHSLLPCHKIYVLLSLCSLCEYNIFGVKIDFCMDTCIVFPQSTIVIVLLTGGVFGIVVTRAYTDYQVGLLFVLWLEQPYGSSECAPVVGAKVYRSGSELQYEVSGIKTLPLVKSGFIFSLNSYQQGLVTLDFS